MRRSWRRATKSVVAVGEDSKTVIPTPSRYLRRVARKDQAVHTPDGSAGDPSHGPPCPGRL
jgi:hypothetical protein